MRGCTGKHPYATKAEAKDALTHLRRKQTDGDALKAYHCHHCGAYHLGRPKRAGAIHVRDHYRNHPAKLARRYAAALQESER